MAKNSKILTVWSWCKKEAVLSIAIILAIISALFVHPDKEYLGYIDFRTLAILFCLMAVMAGVQQLGLFHYIAEKLLNCVKGIRSLVFLLIMLCFFSSMFITNDVALITFVPFSFITLRLILGKDTEKVIIPVVVMQTVAANLGSMLTPIGNPQNLYLYSKTDMNFIEFIRFMLPYTTIAFLMLAVWCLCFRHKSDGPVAVILRSKTSLKGCEKKLAVYAVLFVLSLLAVAHVLPYEVVTILILAVVFFMDKKVLKQVDYTLLLTFIGFFIFIGNMGRVPVFREFLQQIIVDNEILTGVAVSQFMSNVPAALLLSGFTEQYKELIIGTNLGGLGTIIASMASLISFKYIAGEYKHLRGRYLWHFTVVNIVFLVILLTFAILD